MSKIQLSKILQKNLSTDRQLILDDERYVTLCDDIPGRSRYYSSAPTNTKFEQKQKYDAHLLVWVAISSRRSVQSLHLSLEDR